MTGKRQGKLNTSGKVLLVLGVFLLAFIVTMIVIFCVKGMVPDTLIQCVMGSGGIECIALAGIKISKVLSGREPEKGDENERTLI